MKFYTQAEVETMTEVEARSALKALHKQYNLDRPLHEHFDLVWPLLDSITTTYLYLDDHIYNLNDPRQSLRWNHLKPEFSGL
jgi:hypothetical protein